MKAVLLLLAGCVLAPRAATAKRASKLSPPLGRHFLRGVALGHHTDIQPGTLERSLKEIKALGANFVSVVVQWSSRDVRSSKIQPRKGHTTTAVSLARILMRAKAHKLNVILFPIVDIQHRKPLEWRGAIKPDSWKRWWAAYRRFVMHYARIAAKHRVAVFSVGSELVTTEKMRNRWTALIRSVRSVYRGKLLYSANWDHYDPVTFWDHIDLVGLTSYYQLAKKNNANEQTMLASWQRIRGKLSKWAKKKRRKLVFTEVGYPSLDGGAVHPWDYTQGTPVDLEEQRRAYRAFVRAWTGNSSIGGVVFWDWYGKGGPQDTSYTPRNKPAAKVIQRWFQTGSVPAK
jgi:hypothetical protein